MLQMIYIDELGRTDGYRIETKLASDVSAVEIVEWAKENLPHRSLGQFAVFQTFGRMNYSDAVILKAANLITDEEYRSGIIGSAFQLPHKEFSGFHQQLKQENNRAARRAHLQNSNK